MSKHIVVVVICLLSSAAAAPGAQPADGATPARLLSALQAQLAGGELEAARQTARRYVVLDAGNAAVWYNLAGLEEHAGDRDAAADAFSHAVAAGFDDFRAAEADDDLGGLRQDPAFVAHREAARRAWREQARAHEVLLTAGAWSPWRDLAERDASADAPTVRARWRCTDQRLEVEAQIKETHRADILPPWHGGAGLVIAVGAPAVAGDGDAARWREVALGLQDKRPAGALLFGRWQELADLAPKLKYDPVADALVYAAALPWSALAPHHPLLDDTLLINVTYFSLLPTGGSARAALVRDPGTGDAAAGWRRGATLQVNWPPESGPLLRVRAEDAVVASGVMRARAVVVAPRAGKASWRAAAPLTGQGNVVLRAGKQGVPLTLPVPDASGPLTLDVSLTMPEGASLSATEALVKVPAGWIDRARAAVPSLPAGERSSVSERLDAIVRELAARHPQDPVGPLGTTVAEVDALLARAAATGTTLPAAGPYLAILPDDDAGVGPQVALQLPAGFRRDADHLLLLLFVHAPGVETRGADVGIRSLAELAPKLGVAPDRVAVAVPLASSPAPLAAEAAAALVGRTVAWARALMPGVPIAIAGIDAYAAPVLQASLRPAPDLAGVLLMTGQDFDAWPGQDDAALRDILSRADRRMPYGWIRFREEAGPRDRALDVVRVMREVGISLATVQEVPGDLNPAQAWGRATVWASGLP